MPSQALAPAFAAAAGTQQGAAEPCVREDFVSLCERQQTRPYLNGNNHGTSSTLTTSTTIANGAPTLTKSPNA